MASKEFPLTEDITVTVYKHRASRSLRLSIRPNGIVRVSIPAWAPYSAGVQFAHSRIDWIRAQKKPVILLEDGQPIGKAHHLRFFEQAGLTKPSSRRKNNEIIVSFSSPLTSSSSIVQTLAETASIRALRSEAENLLPQRLRELAVRHNFSYKSVVIKRLKGRWGSCDQRKNIVLNLFLMQLPWEYIDYVLLHELTHTEVLRHGPDFWAAMEDVLPDVQAIRKAMHKYQPSTHLN